MTTTDGISLRHFAAPNPNCTALTYNQTVSLIIHNQTSLCHYGHWQCNFHCHRNLYSHYRHRHRHFVLIIVLAIKPLTLTPLPAVSARNSAQRDLIWQLRDELSPCLGSFPGNLARKTPIELMNLVDHLVKSKLQTVSSNPSRNMKYIVVKAFTVKDTVVHFYRKPTVTLNLRGLVPTKTFIEQSFTIP